MSSAEGGGDVTPAVSDRRANFVAVRLSGYLAIMEHIQMWSVLGCRFEVCSWEMNCRRRGDLVIEAVCVLLWIRYAVLWFFAILCGLFTPQCSGPS